VTRRAVSMKNFTYTTCAPRVRAPSSGIQVSYFDVSPAAARPPRPVRATGRGAWAAACVAVAFRIAWPPLWVDTEPALPRPRSPALRTNTYVLESELAASSRR
jgi:hypothetical protein